MGLRSWQLALCVLFAVVALLVEAHGGGGGGRDDSDEDNSWQVGHGGRGNGWGQGGGWGHGGHHGHGHHPCVWWGWWKDWRKGGNKNAGQDKALPLPFFFFSWLDLKFSWRCFPHWPGHGGGPKTTKKTTRVTQAPTTTPTTQGPTTPTFCEWNVTMHCNEVGLNVQRNTGAFMNCSRYLSNDTMNAWNAQCLKRLCDHSVSTDGYRLNQTAKCILYQEFADICNAVLPEGNKLYQQTGIPGADFWRRRYNCSAPSTTAAPPTTTSPLVPPTTTACSAFKKANCGFMQTAKQQTGFWGNCSVIGNATIDAMYQDCLPRLCSVDQQNNTAKCIIYEEFATACINAGGQLGDWRSAYSCPAPETTAAPALAAQQLMQNAVVKSQIAEGAPVAVPDGAAADGGAAAVGGSDASAGGESGDGVKWFDWKVQKASIQRGLAQIQEVLAHPH